MKVNHINIPDEKSNIFCKRINSIIHLDKAGKFWRTCKKCPMLAGTAQGEGVECLYEDPNARDPFVYCISPQLTLERMK